VVSQGLGPEFAQGVLGTAELAVPLFLIAKLFEQPAPDPILLVGRQLRQFRGGRFKYLGHASGVPPGDPLTIGLAVGVLAAVALLAVSIPAIRAARLNSPSVLSE
jgi:hypothetical protein